MTSIKLAEYRILCIFLQMIASIATDAHDNSTLLDLALESCGEASFLFCNLILKGVPSSLYGDCVYAKYLYHQSIYMISFVSISFSS